MVSGFYIYKINKVEFISKHKKSHWILLKSTHNFTKPNQLSTHRSVLSFIKYSILTLFFSLGNMEFAQADNEEGETMFRCLSQFPPWPKSPKKRRPGKKIEFALDRLRLTLTTRWRHLQSVPQRSKFSLVLLCSSLVSLSFPLPVEFPQLFSSEMEQAHLPPWRPHLHLIRIRAHLLSRAQMLCLLRNYESN